MRRLLLWLLILSLIFGVGVALDIVGWAVIVIIVLCCVGELIMAINSFVDQKIGNGFEHLLVALLIAWIGSWFF